MDIACIIFIIAGIAAMAGGEVLQRYVLREGLASKKTVLWARLAFAVPFLGVATIAGIGSIGITEPVNWQLFWWAIAITTIANIVIQYANNEARAIADISLTAPFQGMTPLLVTVAAITLAEYPTWVGVTGIFLIAIGTWIHGRERATTLREYLMPLRMLWLPENFSTLSPEHQTTVRNDIRAVRWAMISAAFGTIGLLFDGVAARNGDVALGWTVQAASLTIIFALTSSTESSRKQGTRWSLLALLGALWALHAILIMSAFRFAPVAYVGSLKRFSVGLTFVLAWWLLAVIQARRRIIPATIIALGAVLLVLDPAAATMVSKADALMRLITP